MAGFGHGPFGHTPFGVGVVVYYPWPATATFSLVGGPAASITVALSPLSPLSQPGAITDAPAVTLSVANEPTATLGTVSDGPASLITIGGALVTTITDY